MYVKAHHNVSILYADVVNYSQLTVSLPPTKLVETLNELFGRFDEASEERNVLRIKFLGDCYYCVAGVPQSNPLHAKSCVDLGLDMIAIIKDVRESCDLRHGLDMRIGIHSGSILSGLVGISKWQYDIWSRDVIIANHMEQTGQPGKVHVTKQTLDLLENKYNYKPADGATRSALLQKNNIETFFIIPAHQNLSEEAANGVRLFNPKQSASTKKTHAAIKAGRRSSPEVMAVSRRRTAFMDNHLHQYQETLRKAENHMEKSIERMHLGIYDRWTCREDINPFCLTFEVLSWELPFIQQPDPLFKYYIACSLGVLIFMFLIQGIGIPSYHWIAWTGFGVALTILLFCIPLTWTYFLWNKFWDPHGDEDDTPEPKNCIVKFLYDLSFNASSNAIFRTCLYIIVSAVLSGTTLLELVDCRKSASTQHECLASWAIIGID
ncbi:Ca(2+)/calmodulin-responsive adenylate cyclase, partial [Gryllus bimaculatus]